MSAFMIEDRKIGLGKKPFVIAELSANHGNDINVALESIDLAIQAGASAVKLQTYTADSLTIDSTKSDFKIKGGLWDGRSLYELYKEANTPWEWHAELFQAARSKGVIIFSSAFDFASVDLLMDLQVPAFKIASFELVDIPLIKYVAKTGKPMIMSTGLSTLDEMEEAVEAAKSAGCENLALLHCISGYPTPLDQVNLAKIDDMRKHFGIEIGFSDHTEGIVASVAAVSRGATIIEKHFTKSRAMGGPDAKFSIEPNELSQMIELCNGAQACIGSATYERSDSEIENRAFRRSLYITKRTRKGEVFSKDNIRSVRPGYGLHTRYLEDIIGTTAQMDVDCGDAVKVDMLSEELRKKIELKTRGTE